MYPLPGCASCYWPCYESAAVLVLLPVCWQASAPMLSAAVHQSLMDHQHEAWMPAAMGRSVLLAAGSL
jgi:hypothetical protein